MKNPIFRLMALVLSIVAVIGFASCASDPQNENAGTGQDSILISGARVYDTYAALPLCAVITQLGFDLAWSGTDRASFICNGTEYVISISDKTLTKAGSDDNYLICAPGSDNSHFVCEISDGDLLVDDNTVTCLFQTFLHYPIQISIDHRNGTVVVSAQ